MVRLNLVEEKAYYWLQILSYKDMMFDLRSQQNQIGKKY